MESEHCLDKLYSSNHSLECKWSAVASGYIDDEFISSFCYGRKQGALLNTLHFLRIKSVRLVLEAFVRQFRDEEVQFVNLGCGLDTLAFWLLRGHKNVTCFELDILSQLERKTSIMRRAAAVMKLIGPEEPGESLIVTPSYKMVPANLNNIRDVEQLVKKYGLKEDKPTLFLSECSLAYLDVNSSNKVIELAAKLSKSPSCFVFWEQAKSDDKFGQLLLERYKELGSQSVASTVYQTVESHIKRYKSLGWEKVTVMDMNEVYNGLVSDEEKARIRKLECLDEVEELTMVCSHFVIGVCATQPDSLSDILDMFARKVAVAKIKGYKTEQVLEMIKKGTTSQMEPASLNTKWV